VKRKICPICDLPVNDANYCTRCKKIVYRPVIWEVNYYLNENLPSQGFISSNPQVDSSARPPQQAVRPVSSPQPQSRTAPQPSRTVPPPRSMTSTQPSGNYMPSAPSAPPQQKTRKRFPFSIAGLITFLFLVMGSAPDLVKKAESLFDNQTNYESAAPFDDSGFRDLVEDDVRAAGIPCTGYDHFPVAGKEIHNSFGQYMEANNYGYLLKPQDVYSDNYEMGTESEFVSYYETTEGYYLEAEVTSKLSPQEEGYIYQYVEINYDTGTGEMHDYMSNLNNEEASLSYLEHFLKLTETAADISIESSSVPAIMEQVKGGLSRGEEIIYTDGIFSLYVSREEDAIQVTVTYNSLLSTENGET
jgi:hypothetical protein